MSKDKLLINKTLYNLGRICLLAIIEAKVKFYGKDRLVYNHLHLVSNVLTCKDLRILVNNLNFSKKYCYLLCYVSFQTVHNYNQCF